MRPENDNALVPALRSSRDPRRLTYSQEEEMMYTPRDQSPRNWEQFAARERAAQRAQYYDSPTERQHARRGGDAMDADMQHNMTSGTSNIAQQVTMESLAAMMAQLMLQLNELSLRVGGTDQLIARYEQVLASHQESLDKLHQEFHTYTSQSNQPTRATSFRTFSTVEDEEYDRRAVVAFSFEGRCIADDEFFTQMLAYVGMQPGQATYTSLAGGKGIRIQFNSIGDAVTVLRRKREIAQRAQVRVDEDLPPHLRQIRQKNRPIFRYLLEVVAKENTWYRMRGGRIQYNDTFVQTVDAQGVKTLERRGTWHEFDVNAFVQTTGEQVDAWWKERPDRRMAQTAPTERSAQEA